MKIVRGFLIAFFFFVGLVSQSSHASDGRERILGYKFEMHFSFRDAPYFTGREYHDGLLGKVFGAERHWEVWILRGTDVLERKGVRREEDLEKISELIARFSLKGRRILGNEGASGESVTLHGVFSELPLIFTILLVERDTFSWNDFYFIGEFTRNEGEVRLGGHSSFEVSPVVHVDENDVTDVDGTTAVTAANTTTDDDVTEATDDTATVVIDDDVTDVIATNETEDDATESID